ncbi:hypothetical protein GUJ93_ZPchr0006g45052 [Zizania palustris]|uniref:Uncharacterized protein n=1 Tax=Zizania palustris TaxID=103762 RepID=A0A8J5VQ38_ZIZPA|nr:hypothetical protein GUJ93_ZPchr0006g45052 [Zizania palustris]
MTIDLNELPLEENKVYEDGVPDLNEAFPFDPPQHPFDLNIPVHVEQENQHEGNELNVLNDYLNVYGVFADVDIVFDEDELSDNSTTSSSSVSASEELGKIRYLLVVDLAIDLETGASGFEAWAVPAAPLVDLQSRPTGMVLGGAPSVPIYYVVGLAIDLEVGASGFEAWAAPTAPLVDVQRRPAGMVLGGAPTARRSHLIAGSDRSALTSHSGSAPDLDGGKGRCADLDGGGKKKLHRSGWRRRELKEEADLGRWVAELSGAEERRRTWDSGWQSGGKEEAGPGT